MITSVTPRRLEKSVFILLRDNENLSLKEDYDVQPTGTMDESYVRKEEFQT